MVVWLRRQRGAVTIQTEVDFVADSGVVELNEGFHNWFGGIAFCIEDGGSRSQGSRSCCDARGFGAVVGCSAVEASLGSVCERS